VSRLRRRIRNLLIVGKDAVSRRVDRPTGSRIVALHDIDNPAAFSERMRWLRSHFAVLPLRELLAGGHAEPAIALTFDDGYASWHETVAPVLCKLSLPATFFVCSGFVGLRAQDANTFARRYLKRRRPLRPLTEPQLQELAARPGFEIGSHTVHHCDLSKPLLADEMDAEIAGDRRCLERIVQRPVRLFAYPFGQGQHAPPLAREAVQRAGFEWAFTIVPQFVDAADSRWMVGRDSLDVAESDRMWAAWMRGAYDGLYRCKWGSSQLRLRRRSGSEDTPLDGERS
jgi:peptidoglycan/xylan/chitin deacetylase (PgdA/CDA1 family)